MRSSYQEIKDEVISSFDVKPLIPCPTFPGQAQIVSCTQKKALVNKNANGGTISQHQELLGAPFQASNRDHLPVGDLVHDDAKSMALIKRQEASEHQTGPCRQKALPAHSSNSDEIQKERRFVYIHAHNSSINLDKMTHHDHSRSSSSRNGIMVPEEHAISQQSYDNEQRDAALVLLTAALNPQSNSNGAKTLHTVNNYQY